MGKRLQRLTVSQTQRNLPSRITNSSASALDAFGYTVEANRQIKTLTSKATKQRQNKSD